MHEILILFQILLHIAENVWIDTLEIRSKVAGYSDLINSSLKPNLIKKQHGVANPEHFKKLSELCDKGGFKSLDTLDDV